MNEQLPSKDELAEAIHSLRTETEVERDRLRDEKSELAPDAARYRWLKAYGKTDGWSDEQIDRQIAIDAALAKAQEGKA